MRRALGFAMVLLFSLPVLGGTITAISPSSIAYKSAEHFMTASGSGFTVNDTFIFNNGFGGRHEVVVNAIDSITGAVTGWVPQAVVNDPGTWTLTVRTNGVDSNAFSFPVTKPGRLPLQIHLPEAITALARSPLGTGIKYEVYTSGGDGSIVTTSCEPASGSTFPFGQSKISCSAFNSSERTSGSIQVNVWDGTAPVLTLPKGFDVPADSLEGAFVKYEASATDDIDGPLGVVCSHASGSLFPNGRTRVNCEAVDNSSNPAGGFFDVFVQPRDPGVLQIKTPEFVKVDAMYKEGAYVDFEVVAYGSADPDPVVECVPASGSYFRTGDTKVGCMATDDFGARAEGGFVVTVVEGNFLRGEDINAEATSPDGAVVSWDVKPNETWAAAIVCSPESGSLFAFGETNVECSSTTAADEPITGKFKVKVADTTAPHIENIRATVGELDAERKLVPVTVEVETIDAGDATPRCSVTTLTSDTTIDWSRTSELSFDIRAENGVPQAFRVAVTCVDAAGNRATMNIPVGASKGRPVKVQ